MIFERSMILCLVVYNFVLVERNLLLFVIPYIIIIYSLRKEVDIMNYISVKAASEKWGISERRIQKLCEENRIDGTEKFGRAWMIPKDAEKPVDGRMKTRNKQEENHEVCGQSQLFRKFASLSYQWDVDKIDQTRYGWLASVENEQLLLRLKKLSKKDLELLTLLFVDGYRQIDVARLWHCSRSAVAQRFKKIKKFLNNT